MANVTQPLREEHRELYPHVEELRVVADKVGKVPVEALRHDVDSAYTFLAHHLIPHAYAEDHALYPVVDRLMGSSRATATMSRDHVEVGRLTDELGELRGKLTSGPLSEPLATDLRRVLYGLYALVKVHFAKEEEVYLPLLDAHLTTTEARDLFAAMEAAARGAKAQA